MPIFTFTHVAVIDTKANIIVNRLNELNKEAIFLISF